MMSQWPLMMPRSPPPLQLQDKISGNGVMALGVFGAVHGHAHEHETPSLLADMCGFKSEEEMEDTKAYLHSHRGYQLEQVGADLCPLFC